MSDHQETTKSDIQHEKEETRKSVHRAAQRTEFIDEIQKVNNPLTKHTDPESEKLYQKLMHKIKPRKQPPAYM